MTRSRLRPFVATLALSLSLAGVVSVPTPASAAFSTPLSVSPTGYDSYDQQLAFDREGDSLYVWVRESHTYPQTRYVQLRSRSRTGTWGTTITLSPSGQSPVGPRVAIDDDGDAIVAWRAFNGTDTRAYARRISKTGTLGPLLTLSAVGVQVHGTNVAIDPDGDAAVTWAEWRSDGREVPMVRRHSRAGILSAASTLTLTPTHAETPAIAYDREGDAVLAWANDNVVQAKTLTAGGTFSALKTVSAPLSPIDRHFTAQVAVDRDGDALVTWRHRTDSNGSTQVWGRWLSRSGTVGNVRQLSPSSHTDVVNHSTASDLDGDVVVTWDRFSTGYLYALPISRTGTLGTAVVVSTFGRQHTVRLDDDGDGVVVWQGKGINGSVSSVAARRISQTGALGTSQVISTIGGSPTTAVTPTGGVAVAWQRRFTVDLRVQVSVGP